MRGKHHRVTNIQVETFGLGDCQNATAKGTSGHQLNTTTQLARIRDSVIRVDMGTDPIGGAIAQDIHRFINTGKRQTPEFSI
jgi:hypothetical protein